MNQFLGRSSNIDGHRFSRDDEQILALNYENVCDSEYLNRLFISDTIPLVVSSPTLVDSNSNSNHLGASITGLDINGQTSSHGAQEQQPNSQVQTSRTNNNQSTNITDNQNETTLNDCLMITPAIPEDMILFGEDPLLGRDFLIQRFYRLELSKLRKYQDPLSTMINRQVLIFDHIGKLMIDRCKESPNKISTQSNMKNKEFIEDDNNYKKTAYFKHLVPDALVSILISLEKQSRTFISQSEIEPILALLVSAMQRRSSSHANSLSLKSGAEQKLQNEMINNMPLSPLQLHYLRSILCNAMMQGVTIATRSNPVSEVKAIEENIKLALCCAYGLLSIGMYSQSTEDLLVAFSNLMCLNLLLDEFSEKLAYLEKGQYTIDRLPSDPTIDNNNNLNEKMRLMTKLSESGKAKKIPQTPSPGGGIATVSTGGVASVTNTPTGALDLRTVIDVKDSPDPLSKLLPMKTWDKSKEKESKRFSKSKSLYDDDDKSLLDKTIPIITNTTVMHVSTNYKNSNNDEDNNKRQSNNHLEEHSPSTHSLKSIITPSPKRSRDRDGNRDLKSTILNLAKVPKNILRKFHECKIQNNKNNHFSSAGVLFSDNKTSISQSYVWSCGQNSYGELGHEDINQRRSFSKVAFLEDKCIVSIGAGNEHSVFVTKDGKLLVSGYNDNGQCGTGSNQQVRQISHVQALEGEYISQVHVYNGCEHTLAITKDGKLFSFGYNYRGQLGLGTTSSEVLPRPVKGLLAKRVVMAACSYHHSIMLCADGVMFSCGRNDCGQLGHGDSVDKKTPQPVINQPQDITSLSCGQYHTLVSTSTGVAYACGKNDYGQLGYESTDSVKSFLKLLGSPEMDTVLQVCCGYYHSLILCHNGLVFGFGRNDYGQLGLGHTQPRVYNCQQIVQLRDKNVLSVTAGCYHSIASTLNGMLYVFGRNNHGQLGTGDLDERHSPHPVDNFVGRRILSVAAGFYHTLVLTVDDVSDNIDDEADVIETKGLIQRQILGTENSVDSISIISSEISVEGPLSKTLPPPLLFATESKSPKINRSRSTSAMIVTDGKSEQSFEIPTRMSVREILIQIVNQLNETVRKNPKTSNESIGELSNDRWICRVLATVGTLLELIRTLISDTERCVELPFLLDESFSILRTLFKITESLVKQYKDDLTVGDDTEEECQDIFVLPQSRLFTSCDIIQEIHAAGNLESKTEMKTVKAQILGKLRQELLFIYLLVPDIGESSLKIVTQSLVEDCSKCLAKTFTVLYHNSSLRAHFFCCLDHVLCSIDSSSLGDELITVLRSSDSLSENRVETSRILRLYTRVSFKYRGNNEVVSLFQSSKQQGLLIFRSLLKVYSHLSLLCLDMRTQQQSCSFLSEFSRAMGILEHCNSNFIKCAIPIIFTLSENKDDDPLYDISSSVISEIFNGAEQVFDLMAHHPLTTDILNILRSGTVIPSILPTFLLYSIAYADKSVICREDVLPFAIALIDKIKSFSQLEIPNVENKNASSSATPSESADNENHNNRNQAPWWAKLSKLSVTLCSKLASSLIHESEKITFENATRSIPNLVTHQVWQYISGPKSISPLLESNTINIDDRVKNICNNMKESSTSSSYNFTQQVAKSSGYINIIENIENTILSTYFSVDKSIFIIGQQSFYSGKTNPYYATIWNHIRNFIMQINSKKSDILSTAQGLVWKDFLSVLLECISNCHLILSDSVNYIDMNFNIIAPSSFSMQSKAKKAFRRVILVIVSLNRWKKHCSKSLSSLAADIVNFYSTVLEIVQNKFLKSNEVDVVAADVVATIGTQLSHGNVYAQTFFQSLTVFNMLLDGTDLASAKVDILSSIFRTMYKNDQNKVAFGWVMSNFCCDSESRLQMKNVARIAIAKIVRIISDFHVHSQSKIFAPSASELNLLSLALKFIHLLSLQNFKGLLSILDIKSFQSLFLSLDEKPSDASNDDKNDRLNDPNSLSEGGYFLAKKSNPRDRKKASRRALNSIISLIQELSISEASGSQSRNYSIHLLETNSELLTNIQQSRVAAALRNTIDIDGLGKLNADSKDSINTSAGGKALKDVKRRCQELITKPIEFRSQEGFVVQGDKLLNNYKGIDFTLATWIYLTKRSPSATQSNSFITGKISHNDAWPLVSVRKDGKLEVIYGHGNEFERLTSTGSISLCSWTHIAIVVEPKKIKIFINGLLDSQIVTKGNARAVLYPIVVGSCPQGVRTRVDHVRDGFDGVLSLFRYYTRALSPIHVRVIFDQGPPESHDIHEKWMYQLMSSTSCLIESFTDFGSSQIDLQKIASTLFGVFVKDKVGNLRCSALKLLEKIFLTEIITDIEITNQSTISNIVGGKSSTSLMSHSLFNNFETFEAKIFSYFILLLGACWMPTLIVAADDNSSNEIGAIHEVAIDPILTEFLGLVPPLLSEKVVRPSSPPFSLSTNANANADNTNVREELTGELCYHIISLLRNLTHINSWKEAMDVVVCRILKNFKEEVSQGNDYSQLHLMEMLGAIVFIGETTSGAFVGTYVNTYHSNAVGRVLNINKSSNNATVLSLNDFGNSRQLSVVRVSDLNCVSISIRPVLTTAVVSAMIDVLVSLGEFTKPILSDLLCIHRPDHPYPRLSLLRTLRPVEVFFFFLILKYFSNIEDQDDDFNKQSMQLLKSKPNLIGLLHLAAVRTVRIKSYAEDPMVDKAISKFWVKSARYLSTIKGKGVAHQLSPPDIEKALFDYVTKYLGIAVDSFQGSSHELLVKQGLLSELIFSIAGSANNQTDIANVFLTRYRSGESCMKEPTMNTAVLQSNIDIHSDADAISTLRLIYHIRKGIVLSSRQLFRNKSFLDETTFSSFPLSWRITLWQSILDSSQCEQMGKEVDYNLIRALYNDNRVQVTHAIASSIRYASISLLQTSSCKIAGNMLESTDIFHRLLQAAHSWIDFHEIEGAEIDLCFQFLKMMLPSLSFVESCEVELQMMQLCKRSLQILCSKLLKDHEPSKECLGMARSNNFILLRARAQEQLSRQKGNALFQFTPLAHNLTQLTAGLEIIQRCAMYSLGLSTSIMGGSEPLQTSPPKIVGVRSTSIDADLSSCISVLFKEDELNTQEISPKAIDSIVIEVAIGVAADGVDCLFETVYYGTSLRFVQSGLSPGCVYNMKCRCFVAGVPLEWSPVVEFHTEIGILFTFDALKCGPDILLSDDGLTASYAGDDSWSTLLGTQPFSSGVTSWEIRIAQSSTAYIFVGVAAGTADLNTFLGGCSNGWGFIGEQALYHNREKVKVYGESFSAGDVIGVILDLNQGTLSFLRNGKLLGVAFDKIYGELFPAVAFYNVGQELEILMDSFHTTCPHERIPCSPSRLNTDEISMITEMIYCINAGAPMSSRILGIVADHCNQWCSGLWIRRKAISGKSTFICKKSPLLQKYGLVVGERVRTPYGIAEVTGSAHDRIWFKMSENPVGFWFFSPQQLQAGTEKGYFLRCTYEKDIDGEEGDSLDEDWTQHAANSSFDVTSLRDLLDADGWSDEMDEILLKFLLKRAKELTVSPWNVPADYVYEDFRLLQQQLSRIVITNPSLLRKWGISGPKRRAAIARLGLLRMFNHMLDNYVPVMMLDVPFDTSSSLSERRQRDDFNPIILTIPDEVSKILDGKSSKYILLGGKYRRSIDDKILDLDSPSNGINKLTSSNIASNVSFSWESTRRTTFSATGLLSTSRHRIFSELKLSHFFELISRTSTRPSKTDDDYDYPDDLPQIRINRLKSYRAKEASDLIGIPGEDLIMSSMYYQLWNELKNQSSHKLRLNYTHPMDDGQSRAFKIRFDGEGVDDYGGPYREIFQKICEELQLPDPSVKGSHKRPWSSDTTDDKKLKAGKCFLPLLHPTPNWSADDCNERYKYIFHPSSLSELRTDLFRFLGQFVGIAIRSKITLDLSFPSALWKQIVKEKLTEKDIASFDAPAYAFVQHLGSIVCRLKSNIENKDALEVLRNEANAFLQDLNWTATLSDGRIVDLIPDGSNATVKIENLEKYLRLYVEARLTESLIPIEAFREGLTSIIPSGAISLLSYDEFENVVCGNRIIDIQRLKDNTEYDDDVTMDDEHIIHFWEALEEFSEEEKSLFLRFVWARPTLPPTGVDFPQKLKIQTAVGDEAHLKPDSYLPKAHTCFFSINLPKYTSKATMSEKLLYAITNCTEMDADFRLQEGDVAGWHLDEYRQRL